MDLVAYGTEVSITSHVGAAAAPTSWLAELGGVGDIAFAVALLEIETLDGAISERLRDLHHVNEVRKAYGERISRLQGYLTAMPDDAESTHVPPADVPGVDLVWDASAASGSGAVQAMMDGRPYDPEVVAPGDIVVHVSREDLEREITRLQGQQDTLGADTEVGMLGLNRLLGRRNQILQLTSNVLASSHQTAMGVIANLKV